MQRRPRQATLLLVLAACAGGLTGCSASPRADSTAGADEAVGRPALESLRVLASRERPVTVDVPTPRGIDPRVIAPFVPTNDEEARRLRTPLAETLVQISASSAPDWVVLPPWPAIDADPTTAADRRWQALRLYARGRDRRLAGDAAGAISDLENAAALDPTSPEVRRELGEALLRAGRRLAAVHALRAAVALGSREPAVLWTLAVDAVRENDASAAAWLLGAARAANPVRTDLALPHLIDAGLSDALSRLGYHTASAESMAAALDLPDQLRGNTQYRAEFAELFRRRGEFARDLGDAHTRLGDTDEADRWYDLAAASPTLEPGSITARRVLSRLRTGRNAAAGLLLVEEIDAAGGLAQDRHIDLIGTLIAPTTAGAAVARALREFETSLPRRTPTVLSSLARARAAASPTDASGILRLRAAEAPDDRAVVGDYLSVSSDDVIGAGLDLIALNPATAPTVGEAIIDSGRGVLGALGDLDARSDESAVLLKGSILATLDLPLPAVQALRDRSWSPRAAPTGLLLLARTSAAGGDWAVFDVALAALKAIGPDAALETTRAALAGQRPVEAWLAAESIADSARAAAIASATTASLSPSLIVAEAAAAAGHAEIARDLVAQAAEADPFDERVYEALLGLYSASGPLNDAQEVTKRLRELRERVPSSRLIRWIASQDLLQRSSLEQARRSLLSLADEDPTNATLLDALDVIAQRAPGAAAEDFAVWLTSRVAERPQSPTLLAASARVLIRAGKGPVALALIDPFVLPGDPSLRPPELSRVRERLLRDAGDAAGADAEAAARVRGVGVSITDALASAEDAVSQRRLGVAGDALSRGLPRWFRPNPAQTRRLLGLLAAAVELPPPTPAPRDLRALFEFAADRDILIPPQLHETRLRKIAALPDVSDDELGAAAALATRQHPTLGEVAYRRAAQTLIDSRRSDRAAGFLVSQLRRMPTPGPSPDLIFDAFRLTASAGSSETIAAFIDAVDNPAWLDELLARTQVVDQLPESIDHKRAELAYTLGVVLHDLERLPEAKTAYRRALAFKPDHAWAANNLGYQIAEEEIGDLAEAERLLLISVKALPEDGSVLDSLGWIRYRAGVLADETDAAGTIVREGALTLLTRAAATDKGRENPVILDHLGDALFASGRREDASRAWDRARSAARQQLQIQRLANANQPAPPSLLKAEQLLAMISAKLDALQGGREPAYTPPGIRPGR